MKVFTCNKDGIVYAGSVFVGFISKAKTGEKFFTPRDGYCVSAQGLLELKHLLDNYQEAAIVDDASVLNAKMDSFFIKTDYQGE